MSALNRCPQQCSRVEQLPVDSGCLTCSGVSPPFSRMALGHVSFDDSVPGMLKTAVYSSPLAEPWQKTKTPSHRPRRQVSAETTVWNKCQKARQAFNTCEGPYVKLIPVLPLPALPRCGPNTVVSAGLHGLRALFFNNRAPESSNSLR